MTDKFPQFTLIDDGTLDTVIRYKGMNFRFDSMEEYRNTCGTLNLDEFLEDYAEEIIDSYHVMTCAGE